MANELLFLDLSNCRLRNIKIVYHCFNTCYVCSSLYSIVYDGCKHHLYILFILLVMAIRQMYVNFRPLTTFSHRIVVFMNSKHCSIL